MKEEELNEEIALLGIKQFVRARFIKAIREDKGAKDTEAVVRKLNIDMVQEFRKIAKEEIESVVKEIKKALQSN